LCNCQKLCCHARTNHAAVGALQNVTRLLRGQSQADLEQQSQQPSWSTDWRHRLSHFAASRAHMQLPMNRVAEGFTPLGKVEVLAGTVFMLPPKLGYRTTQLHCYTHHKEACSQGSLARASSQERSLLDPEGALRRARHDTHWMGCRTPEPTCSMCRSIVHLARRRINCAGLQLIRSFRAYLVDFVQGSLLVGCTAALGQEPLRSAKH
jgi:hypothetical protein